LATVAGGFGFVARYWVMRIRLEIALSDAADIVAFNQTDAPVLGDMLNTLESAGWIGLVGLSLASAALGGLAGGTAATVLTHKWFKGPSQDETSHRRLCVTGTLIAALFVSGVFPVVLAALYAASLDLGRNAGSVLTSSTYWARRSPDSSFRKKQVTRPGEATGSHLRIRDRRPKPENRSLLYFDPAISS
jgi:hypothetical protein